MIKIKKKTQIRMSVGGKHIKFFNHPADCEQPYITTVTMLDGDVFDAIIERADNFGVLNLYKIEDFDEDITELAQRWWTSGENAPMCQFSIFAVINGYKLTPQWNLPWSDIAFTTGPLLIPEFKSKVKKRTIIRNG